MKLQAEDFLDSIMTSLVSLLKRCWESTFKFGNVQLENGLHYRAVSVVWAIFFAQVLFMISCLCSGAVELEPPKEKQKNSQDNSNLFKGDCNYYCVD